jgi:hypothetical protein
MGVEDGGTGVEKSGEAICAKMMTGGFNAGSPGGEAFG